MSFDPDATVLPSGEKATALTQSSCPSSFCLSAPHRLGTFGITSKYFSKLSLKVWRKLLSDGANSNADKYICSGASSMMERLRSVKRLTSSNRFNSSLPSSSYASSQSGNSVDDVRRLPKPAQGFHPMKHVLLQESQDYVAVLDQISAALDMLDPVAASVCDILGQGRVHFRFCY
ncbi:hypothetical protein MBLNU13_g10344t1 [Cladosporium sp. NU13]